MPAGPPADEFGVLEQLEAVFDTIFAVVLLDDPRRVNIWTACEEQIFSEALSLFGFAVFDLFGLRKDGLAFSAGDVDILLRPQFM